MSVIDFSAQFGGQDAAEVVLPHFKALKAAGRSSNLEGFPFPKLAFILRVDGEVRTYGLSGLGNLDVDSDGDYLSFDIGITRTDRLRMVEAITSAIFLSPIQLKKAREAKELSIDYASLQQCLNDLCARYQAEVAGQTTMPTKSSTAPR